MLSSLFRKIALVFILTSATAQTVNEVAPPYNIKSVSFVQNNQNQVPVFKLGDGFLFQFDDLFGNEANYYCEIVHCDYNWIPSEIPKTDYLQGFDGQRIQEYTNSVNTLQIYSHYQFSLPNQNTQLRISGNYILKILDENKEVVLSRKLILYEDLTMIPFQIKRSRTLTNIEFKQNMEFSIKSNTLNFQNPLKNVKVMLVQNGQFNTAIKNIVPQYTIGNELVYKYDSQTQFWGGNEFLYFDNNNILASGNNISRIESGADIYKSYLYTNRARRYSTYSLNEDVNGNFVARNSNATNNDTESDYAWVYFSLSAPAVAQDKGIYIVGMFNNYSLTPEYKMDYNTEKGIFEKAILIKQGFTNYKYTLADDKGNIDNENAIDGNFYQTENEYSLIVYYRENNDRYDRAIGKGNANSSIITN